MRKSALIILSALLIAASAYAKSETSLDLNALSRSLLTSKADTTDYLKNKTLMEYGGQDIAHHNPTGNVLDGRMLAA